MELVGEGDPLLWLHGGMGCGADWRYIFKNPPEGYMLITPDLRGHGASTNSSGVFTFRQCARDIHALLGHLHIDRVKAIGLSGGGIALLHIGDGRASFDRVHGGGECTAVLPGRGSSDHAEFL